MNSIMRPNFNENFGKKSTYGSVNNAWDPYKNPNASRGKRRRYPNQSLLLKTL